MDLTPAVKKYVEEKIGNLDKFIGANEAKVELEKDKHHQSGDIYRAEVNLKVGGKLMRAEADSSDIFASIDMVVPKLKEQVSKFKDKKTDLARKGARAAKGMR